MSRLLRLIRFVAPRRKLPWWYSSHFQSTGIAARGNKTSSPLESKSNYYILFMSKYYCHGSTAFDQFGSPSHASRQLILTADFFFLDFLLIRLPNWSKWYSSTATLSSSSSTPPQVTMNISYISNHLKAALVFHRARFKDVRTSFLYLYDYLVSIRNQKKSSKMLYTTGLSIPYSTDRHGVQP